MPGQGVSFQALPEAVCPLEKRWRRKNRREAREPLDARAAFRYRQRQALRSGGVGGLNGVSGEIVRRTPAGRIRLSAL